MQVLIHEDFLLKNETARVLYHEHSKVMPIVDYHCHINPQEIYEDRHYDNLTTLWLGADHYKWRVLRANGVEESRITGDADPYDKFLAWAEVVPKLIGNPLYHWTQLELARYFHVYEPLSLDTAPAIWEKANQVLKTMGVRKIVELSNVTSLCTTDDPVDSLVWHKKLQEEENFQTVVLPAFRPDKAINIDKAGFAAYIDKLAKVADFEIRSLADVKSALAKRLDYFVQLGCLTSDHGLDAIVCQRDEKRAEQAFLDAISDSKPDLLSVNAYKTEILLFLAKLYTQYNLVMQLHYGTVRDNSSKMYELLGPDSGFDAIAGVANSGASLAALFDLLEQENALPKTIVYSINPCDNAQIASVLGCFNREGIRNKMQHGSAWWFNDTKHGMEEQLISFSENSVLANFVGMLTDSRSFLSYTRHEYFRRILCNLIGSWVEDGEYPKNMKVLGAIVEDISYNNAIEYFGFKTERE